MPDIPAPFDAPCPDREAPAGRPGSLTFDQWSAILLAYSGLGREPMLVISERAGRDVHSVMDLSYSEAAAVLAPVEAK